MKKIFKLLVVFIVVLLMFSASVMATGKAEVVNEDLYLSEENYNLTQYISGNVYASADNFTLDPSAKGGTVSGDLFVSADNVTFKSDVTYSEKTDEYGNAKIDSINSFSSVYGNVFVTADVFTLEPGCEIEGSLFITAREVNISRSSTVYGNIYAVADKITIDGQVGSSVYATSSNFNLGVYGYIYNDLTISSDDITLEGRVNRKSKIYANNFVSNDTFFIKNSLEIDANSVTFAGEANSNVKVNSKSFELKEEQNSVCLISGNLDYSSQNELQIDEGTVLGTVSYSKYVSPNSFKSIAIKFVKSLLILIIFIIVPYYIIKFIMPALFAKVETLTVKNVLLSMLFGLITLFIVPIVFVLLVISHVASLIGVILILLYTLLIFLSIPVAAINISELVKSKIKKELNIIIYLLSFALILALIGLVPYVGMVVYMVLMFLGLGQIVMKIFKK